MTVKVVTAEESWSDSVSTRPGRLLNPHAIGAGSAPGGELEAVDRAGTDAALLDLEVRERGWEEVWVVGAEVRDQPTDMLGRGADPAFGRHVQVDYGVIMPERPQPCSVAARRSRQLIGAVLEPQAALAVGWQPLVLGAVSPEAVVTCTTPPAVGSS